MPRLFSYTMAHDDGAAPNPFRGLCTLAICKPKIRLKAAVGDWVLGLGSVNAPSGNLGGRMVYTMRVDQVLTWRDYDRLAPEYWPSRIPNLASPVICDRLGDCIYDFSAGAPIQRPGVHTAVHMPTDLSGQNVLLSRHFFYFGANAIVLPPDLLPLVHQTQSHKVKANDSLVAPFLAWIASLHLEPNYLYGWPDGVPDWDKLAERCGRMRC
jgi:hypothetical protein